MLFPAVEAVHFGGAEVAVDVLHQSCLNVWAIGSPMEHTEHTTHLVHG